MAMIEADPHRNHCNDDNHHDEGEKGIQDDHLSSLTFVCSARRRSLTPHHLSTSRPAMLVAESI
jgi:hypothetical protein